jgi:hypothetical protein
VGSIQEGSRTNETAASRLASHGKVGNRPTQSEVLSLMSASHPMAGVLMRCCGQPACGTSTSRRSVRCLVHHLQTHPKGRHSRRQGNMKNVFSLLTAAAAAAAGSEGSRRLPSATARAARTPDEPSQTPWSFMFDLRERETLWLEHSKVNQVLKICREFAVQTHVLYASLCLHL